MLIFFFLFFLQVKNFRHYNGPNVLLSTNLLWTYSLLIICDAKRLTGRHTLNKKEKEPLKSTMLLKLISSE